MRRYGIMVLAVLCFAAPAEAQNAPVVVGSKQDNEGRLLAEIIAQLLEARGRTVTRKPALGSTLICLEALRTGEIDLYPEYSGTIEQEILKLPGRAGFDELQQRVRRDLQLELLPSFGFNNAYAIAVSRPVAKKHGLRAIGDLAKAPELRLAFSHEFLNRADGWPGLSRAYGLGHRPAGILHTLAYRAIHQGKFDATDAYTTDGELVRHDLVLLDDDRAFFPRYLAAPLVRPELEVKARSALAELTNSITDEQMRALNTEVLSSAHRESAFAVVANRFLRNRGLIETTAAVAGRWADVPGQVATHLMLTGVSLLAAIAVAVPLGIAAYRMPRLARPIVYLTGVLQTIPSLALLAFMIPLLGIGVPPALAALFLYALLPILRNTTAALFAIDPVLKKVSVGMGLTVWQRLRHVELPLAMPNILAGVRTAAVINIGAATLAAFIGAGGLGDRIVTGLATTNYTLVLEGASLAALLAVLTELAFEGLERLLVPRHLLQKPVE